MTEQATRQKKSAEQYACESLARNMKTWVIYDKKESLEKWLENNVPSKVFQLEDVGWLSMPSIDDDATVNYDNIELEWQELKSSGRPVDYNSVCEIAKKNNLLTGNWTAHVNSDLKADILWNKVAKEYLNGALVGLALSCKVSHHDAIENYRDGSYVFTIGNADFSNRDAVYELEKAIRDAGIKSRLMYKPAVYTHLGIYRNNQFQIRPTIYLSDYDILQKKSKISALYESAENDLQK